MCRCCKGSDSFGDIIVGCGQEVLIVVDHDKGHGYRVPQVIADVVGDTARKAILCVFILEASQDVRNSSRKVGGRVNDVDRHYPARFLLQALSKVLPDVVYQPTCCHC